MRVSTLSVFAAMLAGFCSAVILPAAAAADKTVWDGVYTSEQATRGAAVYATECSACHRDGLPERAAPAADGGRFMEAWGEDSLKSLFTVLKTTMPQSAPASLSDAAYADIVAYILKENAFPAGAEELTPAALDTIRVQAKGGPEAVPNFALVQVVGCLTRAADKSWRLDRATEPVRTRDPNAADETKADETVPAGTHSFKLLQLYLGADSDSGRQVEVRGFLIRVPNDDRINVTSIRKVAETCPD
jgi:S-disulfanyl-L-cysteine oxidoreductase SoxD